MKIVSLIVISLILSSCAGTGLNKKTTLMPDSINLQVDTRPHRTGKLDDLYIGEITMGVTWNLK